MLKSFEERERTAELLYARAEEARFSDHCAAIRAVAALAVRKLGVDEATAEPYARALIAAWIDGLKDEALLERVRADLATNGVEVPFIELRAELAAAEARRSYVARHAAAAAGLASAGAHA